MYWWKIGGGITLALLVFFGLLGYRILSAINSSGNDNKRVPFFTQLGHLVTSRDALLRGEAQDRINILLLGIGGAGHDGPLLTDTIMLASVQPSTGNVVLLSIPRDLAVEIPRYGIRKINNANAFGKELGYPGGGEQLAADVVAKTVGQPIHYYARVDFEGFKDIIDDLGGITVTVENSFTDAEYPTNNYGYQTIRFKAGAQQLDGDAALKYVRSRHGNNGEGSDFARSRRQQLVLESVRDKVFSLGTMLNPVKIGSVLSSLGSHTRTNLEVWEMLRLGKMIRGANQNNITSKVLDSAPEGLLKNATGLDGAFLLLPKDGTFRTVKAFTKNIFILPRFPSEQARITIRDESGRAGTGRLVASSLELLGFTAPTVETRAPATARASSVLIDYSKGLKPFTLNGLEDYLDTASVASTSLDALDALTAVNASSPSDTNAVAETGSPDFLIIIGKDFSPATTMTIPATTKTNVNSNKNTNASVNTNSNTNKNANGNVNKNSNTNTGGTNINATNLNANSSVLPDDSNINS